MARGMGCGSDSEEVGVGAAEDDGGKSCVEPRGSDCEGLNSWSMGTVSEDCLQARTAG